MITPNQRRLAALVLAVALVPSVAGAQAIARSFGELQQIVKIGQTVFVTDTGGRQTRGKIAVLTPSSLVLLTPETLTFLEGSVTDIRRTDRWWKGAVIGLGVGILPGLAAGAAGCAEYNYPGCVWGPIYGMLSVGGISAAVGMGIDAAVKKVGRVVYLSPQLAVTVVAP